jgi:uncharacterized protein (DUF3084 family)
MIIFLGAFTLVTNAQGADADISTTNDTIAEKSKLLEDKLNKQEQQLQELKMENETLKKEVKQLKSALPVGKRKFTVSRIGSKQLMVQ